MFSAVRKRSQPLLLFFAYVRNWIFGFVSPGHEEVRTVDPWDFCLIPKRELSSLDLADEVRKSDLHGQRGLMRENLHGGYRG